jgi:hypothetical protein
MSLQSERLLSHMLRLRLSHQSPPPLHRPASACVTVVLPVEEFAANGEQCLIRLSQPRGPPHNFSFSDLD